jgi:purine-binding chemotaxis protein CheW
MPEPTVARDRQAEGMRVVLARVASRTCAVPLAQVIETMRILPIHPLAEAPPFVRGVAIVRGAVVPVVDLRALLGEPAAEAARLLVVRTAAAGPASADEGRRVALAVDAVTGVATLDAAALAATPPLVEAGRPELVAALGAVDGQLLMLLRTSHLVDEALWGQLPA